MKQNKKTSIQRFCTHYHCIHHCIYTPLPPTPPPKQTYLYKNTMHGMCISKCRGCCQCCQTHTLPHPPLQWRTHKHIQHTHPPHIHQQRPVVMHQTQQQPQCRQHPALVGALQGPCKGPRGPQGSCMGVDAEQHLGRGGSVLHGDTHVFYPAFCT